MISTKTFPVGTRVKSLTSLACFRMPTRKSSLMCLRLTSLCFCFRNRSRSVEHSFNQDLSEWDLRSVQRMSFMFDGADQFDQSLCEWGRTLVQHGKLSTVVTSLFDNTRNCPTSAPPDLTLEIPGPFCYLCDKPRPSGENPI